MGKSAVFGSDKGGVGKTTTVANVASALVSKESLWAFLNRIKTQT